METAFSCREAEERIENGAADFLILDVNMPFEDGFLSSSGLRQCWKSRGFRSCFSPHGTRTRTGSRDWIWGG